MLNQSTLSNFSGSETFTRHAGLILTDGMLYVANNGGKGDNSAFWLLDVAASYKFVPAVAREPFQVYKLTKNKSGSGATVTVEDGSDKVVFTQRIPVTDFDFAGAGGTEFVFWVVDGTALLPSEY